MHKNVFNKITMQIMHIKTFNKIN